ncbi:MULTISPECIES: tyrosine-type recombinase/integrase [Rhizobium]|uniref:Site-specific integrase n=1 Tax=Rhizobium aouanii TaxID=3118145 RepID=A0ABU8CL41_9HYPH|nr:site-specific integrase [Rhizobium acaciae]MCW1410763.1 site-specific integrase [Rhizobium acaciae]MCW1742938.1 site-specific integrase [Rhizobium acaciae]MCW1750134.1 site-specific integrase [Rhizobium acaciae]
MDSHKVLGDKVRVYRRPNSSVWQCATYIDGKEWRVSTKTDSLSQAKEVAEDWYFELKGKSRAGQLKQERTFADAAKQFVREYEPLTNGERNPRYVKDHEARLDNHLLPYFGNIGLSALTAGKVQEYRVMRLQPHPTTGKVPTRSTLHHETVTLRQVTKTALRHGWISHLPDFSAPYRASSKISHRAWFSPEEYKRLYTYTRGRVASVIGESYEHAVAQLHDYVLFMANTGLRPDEANRLEYRDVTFEEDAEGGERILLIEVRGKRGVGYCKSTTGAVHPFERLVKRNNPKPTDLVFPQDHKKQFNRALAACDLKFDREGNRRSAYSLRHTYICLRLLEGADIYQIAKNCRTSVEMIEKHYAVHLKNTLDAKAINVRRRTRAAIAD